MGETSKSNGPRFIMKNFSKRMTTLLSKVEERSYSPIEAIKLVKENANAKFDETIEAHIRLGLSLIHI